MSTFSIYYVLLCRIHYCHYTVKLSNTTNAKTRILFFFNNDKTIQQMLIVTFYFFYIIILEVVGLDTVDMVIELALLELEIVHIFDYKNLDPFLSY